MGLHAMMLEGAPEIVLLETQMLEEDSPGVSGGGVAVT